MPLASLQSVPFGMMMMNHVRLIANLSHVYIDDNMCLSILQLFMAIGLSEAEN